MTLSYDIQVYYKKWDTSSWVNVTEYAAISELSWNNNLRTEFLEFDLDLIQPLDGSNIPIIPEAGDDIVITTDTSRTEVLGQLGGFISEIDYKINSYDCENNRWHVTYELRIQQRNSSEEYIEFSIKTPTPLSTILDQIFDSYTNDASSTFTPTTTSNGTTLQGYLGGYINGSYVPKYVLESTDIDVNGFESDGSSISCFIDLMKNVNYNWDIRYYIQPDATTTLKLVQQVVIFDKQGIVPPSASGWDIGITDATLKSGYVTIDSTRLYTEAGQKLSYKLDTDKIDNFVAVSALVQDGNVLTNRRFTADGGTTDYILDEKANDILYACRLVTSDIVSVASDTVFNINAFVAPRIVADQADLVKDPLVCRIIEIADPTNYSFHEFTISGSTITMTTPFTGLDKNLHRFELVNGYDIYKEDLSESEYGTRGAIKKIKPTDNGVLQLFEYDLPSDGDEVSVWYNALIDTVIQRKFINSIRRYGMNYVQEDIKEPITQSQFDAIDNALEENAKIYKEVKFTSFRPDLVEVGYNIPVNLTGLFQVTDLLVQKVQFKYIANSGQDGKPTVEQKVTLAPYRDKLEDVIKGVKDSAKSVASRGVPQFELISNDIIDVT